VTLTGWGRNVKNVCTQQALSIADIPSLSIVIGHPSQKLIIFLSPLNLSKSVNPIGGMTYTIQTGPSSHPPTDQSHCQATIHSRSWFSIIPDRNFITSQMAGETAIWTAFR
jgi:hypothetical protein